MAEHFTSIAIISLTTLSFYTFSTFYRYLIRPSSSSPPGTLTGNVQRHTVSMPEDDIDGARERNVLFYIPQEAEKKEKGQNPALLIYLHGRTETGDLSRSSTTRYQYDIEATRISQTKGNRGWIVAYPSGYQGCWNDLRAQSHFESQKVNIHDSLFLLRVMELAVDKYQVSISHIFVTGFSNGGQMCLRLAQELGTVTYPTPSNASPRVRAIGLHATTLPHHTNLRPVIPIGTEPPEFTLCPIVMVNGTKDPVTPFHGGESALIGVFRNLGLLIGKGGLMQGVIETAEEFAGLWRKELRRHGPNADNYELQLHRKQRSLNLQEAEYRNAVSVTEWSEVCAEAFDAEIPLSPRSPLSPMPPKARRSSRSVTSVDWERVELDGPEGKTLVKCYVVKGEGHTVALNTPDRRLPLVMGPQLQVLNSPQKIMQFFEQFLD